MKKIELLKNRFIALARRHPKIFGAGFILLAVCYASGKEAKKMEANTGPQPGIVNRSPKQSPTQYFVIEGFQRGELNKAVTKAMNDGWRPQGGVLMGEAFDGHHYFYQAVVK